MINDITKIRTSRCTGCAACYSLCPTKAIKIIKDDYGFDIPVINRDMCISCGMCFNNCPTSIERKNHDEAEVYALTHTVPSVRMNSSSGGAFYWLASYVLSLGGIVYGAALSKNGEVRHIRVETSDNLTQLQSSKYVQSSIGDCFIQTKKDVDDGKIVLFSGTPCQIGGLYSVVKKDTENLITADVLCYGAPSPLVFKEYLKEITHGEPIVSLNMRDKKQGWVRYSMRIETDTVRYTQDKYYDIYQRGFQTHVFYRESCFTCTYRDKQRIGDFTFGDFWGFKERFTKGAMRNDDMGISFIMLNTIKAKRIFKNMGKNDVIIEKRRFEDNADNFGFGAKVDIPTYRDDFFCQLKKQGYKKAITPYLRTVNIDNNVSRFRILYRKLKKNYYFRWILNKLVK